jgi:hypothetical protein
MARTHAFFNHSPKRLVEFQKLAENIETKGLRPLKNVATRWVSLLEPLRRLLGEYRTLMAKMHADRAASADKYSTYIFSFLVCQFVFLFFFFPSLILSVWVHDGILSLSTYLVPGATGLPGPDAGSPCLAWLGGHSAHA